MAMKSSSIAAAHPSQVQPSSIICECSAVDPAEPVVAAAAASPSDPAEQPAVVVAAGAVGQWRNCCSRPEASCAEEEHHTSG